MSDYDNIRENRFLEQQEREEIARQERIDYYTDVLKGEVLGTQKITRKAYDYVNFERVYRTATPADVVSEEMEFADFAPRVTQFFVDACKNGNEAALKLLEDMAKDYAEREVTL